MPIKSKYLFVASMDVDPDRETLFNEIYDTEHVPNLLKVPGVHAVARMEGEPFAMSIGGEQRMVVHDGPRHSAIYEIDGPHVPRYSFQASWTLSTGCTTMCGNPEVWGAVIGACHEESPSWLR